MSKLYRVTRISHAFIMEKNEEKALEYANNCDFWTEDGMAIREANISEYNMLGYEYNDDEGCYNGGKT